MKLGFEESPTAYTSGSQSARAWTEAWVSAWAYCPHCGNAKISSFPNNSPLADFFCTSCREEMQDLAAIDHEYAPRGLRVVAVSVDAGSEKLVRRFVQRESLTFPVVHDQAGTIQKQYHIVGVPTSYLVAADGRLLWQQVGGIHGNLPKVRAELEKALR